MRAKYITDQPTKNGNYYSKKYDAAPYYIKPTVWERWQPAAWYSWFLGLPLPGDEGDKYHPQGYKIPDVGPQKMSGKGGDFAKGVVEQLRSTRSGGCVFMVKNE